MGISKQMAKLVNATVKFLGGIGGNAGRGTLSLVLSRPKIISIFIDCYH